MSIAPAGVSMELKAVMVTCIAPLALPGRSAAWLVCHQILFR